MSHPPATRFRLSTWSTRSRPLQTQNRPGSGRRARAPLAPGHEAAPVDRRGQAGAGLVADDPQVCCEGIGREDVRVAFGAEGVEEGGEAGRVTGREERATVVQRQRGEGRGCKGRQRDRVHELEPDSLSGWRDDVSTLRWEIPTSMVWAYCVWVVVQAKGGAEVERAIEGESVLAASLARVRSLSAGL